MAYLGGGFTSAVAAAGNAILSGKELQERDEDIQLKKQQIAMGQIAVQNAQRQQQTQATVGAFLSSEAQKDASSFTDPAKSAQLYEKAAGLALQGGDFVSANEMGELAKGKMQEAKEQLVVAAQQKHQKQEDLATTADDYSTNPTPEGAKDLMRKAIDAGVNPTSIPMPGTPQWGTWVNSQKQAAMDSKSRAELAEKAQEFTQRQQQQKEEFQIRQQDLQFQRQNNAMLKEAMVGIARDRLDLERQKATSSPKETANEKNTSKAIIASASEGVRGLHVIGALDSDQTAGPFAGLHDGTILDAVAKTGTNAMTSDDAQIYHTAAAGMGLEVSRALTLGGGRGANQATINEMQNIIEAHPGDSKATALFKYATAADIIRNRLESMTPPQDSVQEANRQKLLKDLSKIPAPSDIIKAVKSPKERSKMLAAQGSMANVQEQMAAESGTGLPGAPDIGAGTNVPPIPPANIQSLLDKYK